MTDTSYPWSLPVMVAQIPEGGLHQELTATADQRVALAALGGLRDVIEARASFDLTPISQGRVRVTGRLQAIVGQTCVVTLEPVDNSIDEPIDLVFAPPAQIPEMADLVDDDSPAGTDPLEPIEQGAIDLGHVAADALFLAIDPYPRRSDAVFQPPVETVDPDEHPFAALKALKSPEAGAKTTARAKTQAKTRSDN